MIYNSSIAEKFNVDDIKHQLEIRGVMWGPHCKKKAAFQQLWLDNSALADKRVVVPAIPSSAEMQMRNDSLRAQQNAVPLTPPRGGSAAPPMNVAASSAPFFSPRTQEARRRQGLPWLNV